MNLSTEVLQSEVFTVDHLRNLYHLLHFELEKPLQHSPSSCCHPTNFYGPHCALMLIFLEVRNHCFFVAHSVCILNEGFQYTCVAGFAGSKTIELNQSVKGILGDVTLWNIHKHFRCILSALLHNINFDSLQLIRLFPQIRK